MLCIPPITVMEFTTTITVVSSHLIRIFSLVCPQRKKSDFNTDKKSEPKKDILPTAMATLDEL